jgi:hypothetical protein
VKQTKQNWPPDEIPAPRPANTLRRDLIQGALCDLAIRCALKQKKQDWPRGEISLPHLPDRLKSLPGSIENAGSKTVNEATQGDIRGNSIGSKTHGRCRGGR